MPGEDDAETRPKIEESKSMLQDKRVAWARGGVESYMRS